MPVTVERASAFPLMLSWVPRSAEMAVLIRLAGPPSINPDPTSSSAVIPYEAPSMKYKVMLVVRTDTAVSKRQNACSNNEADTSHTKKRAASSRRRVIGHPSCPKRSHRQNLQKFGPHRTTSTARMISLYHPDAINHKYGNEPRKSQPPSFPCEVTLSGRTGSRRTARSSRT